MLEETKKETNTLLNSLLPFGMEQILKNGEFYPYAGYMDKNSKMVMLGFGDNFGKEKEAKDFIKSSETLLQGMCKENKAKAVGIVFMVKTAIPHDSISKIDAIKVVLEHKGDYSIEVFLPYTFIDRVPTFGKIHAQKGKPNFFFGK